MVDGLDVGEHLVQTEALHQLTLGVFVSALPAFCLSHEGIAFAGDELVGDLQAGLVAGVALGDQLLHRLLVVDARLLVSLAGVVGVHVAHPVDQVGHCLAVRSRCTTPDLQSWR